MADEETKKEGNTGASNQNSEVSSDNIAEEVGLPPRAPAAPPLPSPTGNLEHDVARILEEIKLPERK